MLSCGDSGFHVRVAFRTFTGREADVEVDDVGAVVEALGGAEHLLEVVVHEEVRGESNRNALQSACFDALVGFDPLLLLLGYDDR